MTVEQKSNGNATEPPANAGLEQTPQTATPPVDPRVLAQQYLEGFAFNAMHLVLRGLLACLSQFDPEHVLIAASGMLGKVISVMYCGEEIRVRQVRKACKDAFKGELKAAPVLNPQAAATKAATALPAGAGASQVQKGDDPGPHPLDQGQLEPSTEEKVS